MMVSFMQRASMFRRLDSMRRCGGSAVVAVFLASGMSVLAQKPPAHTVDRGPLSAPKVTVNRTTPKVPPPRTTFAFSARPTVNEIFAARAFREPLVPVGGAPIQVETTALAQALVAYTRGDTAGSVEPFIAFLAAHPETPWRASVQLNIGARYRTAGAWSRALRAWEDAWTLAKSGDDASSRAVADLAVGEWLLLNAQLGRSAVVTARAEELRDRPMRGTAAVKVGDAREIAAMTKSHPDKVVSSGPQALMTLLAELKVAAPSALAEYRPTAAGTSLLQLRDLSRASSAPMRMVRRLSGTDIPVPSVIHWQVNHYAAIVEQQGEQFRIVDRGMGGSYWMSRELLLEEASGYFLVPNAVSGSDKPDSPWIEVDEATAATIVGFSCPPGGPPPNEPPDCEPCRSQGGFGMVTYEFHPVTASLRLLDTPVGYGPPRGPRVHFRLTYHQRDALQPQIFTSSHVGHKWMTDWFRYLQEEPADVFGINPPHVWVLLAGGGRELAKEPVAGVYPSSWRTRATIVKVSESPLRYERRLRDGTVEVFAVPDSAPAGQRRVYLTQIIDPQQEAVTLTWDAQQRLVAITDALGEVTTLSYSDSADPLRLTSVTDPFGRAATFAYNSAGQLESITDVLGMVSRMTYGSEDFVSALTTPYGTTTFRREHLDEYVNRFVEATDPLGGTERIEFRWNTTAIPATEPTNAVPTGFSAHNADLDAFNTIYWDKTAWSRAPGDVTAATITRWVVASELPTLPAYSTGTAHSVKRALESRVWYAYADQLSPGSAGAWTQPIAIARVLDDGSSQVSQATHNAQGSVLTRTDPLGRRTSYSYAANGIDLLDVRQTTGGMNDLLLSHADYVRHRPGTITDIAGQTTTVVYNSAGQVVTATNARGETTTNAYDVDGRLTSVSGAVSGATTTFTYDGYGRIRTVTEADSPTLTIDYDALDRPTRTTYPDATFEETTYDRLDRIAERDRAGRITRFYHDALGRVIGIRDPLGRLVAQEWCACGTLDAVVDGLGNRTRWERNVQGRATREIRADGLAGTSYAYGQNSGRLLKTTDSKEQVTTYSYALDDQLLSTVFTGGTSATPSVTYSYDSQYGRIATMVDGSGTTTFAYHPVGQLGAGQVATVDGPLSNDTITYSYDTLGRMATRSIDGQANAVTWSFDALGRVSSETNLLGMFAYDYDGATARLATVTYPNGQTSHYTYLPTAQDRRLQTIHHKHPNGSTLSKFDYTYDHVGNILTWRQQAGAESAQWAFDYDAVDQLVVATKSSTASTPAIMARYAYAYDAAGNRTAEQVDDHVRGASYDKLNRLLSQQSAGPLLFQGSVSEPAQLTVQGAPVPMAGDKSFKAPVTIAPGSSTVTITATDASGNSATRQYGLSHDGTSKVFDYDSNGNLIADGTRTFEWDAKNQLVALVWGTTRTEFSYNGSGQRVRIKTFQGGGLVNDTYAVWSEDVLRETRTSGASVVRSFNAGIEQNGTLQYVTSDHLSSVTAVTNAAGSVIASYTYDPFGRQSSVIGTANVDRGFAALVSGSSGEYLATFRGYDPETGRWLQPDPEGIADGLNVYRYVHNNPVGRIDPLGLATVAVNVQTQLMTNPFTLAAVCQSKPCGACARFGGASVAFCPNTPCSGPVSMDMRFFIQGTIYAYDGNFQTFFRVNNCKPHDRSVVDTQSALAHERQHITYVENAVMAAMQTEEAKTYASKAACDAAIPGARKRVQKAFQNATKTTQTIHQ